MFAIAEPGKIWVWTSLTESIYPDRKAGEPVWERLRCSIYKSWADNGWVEQKEKERIEMKLWVARDPSGTLLLHEGKPHKDKNGHWFNRYGVYFVLGKRLFRDLKPDSEPIEVELKVVEKDV